MSYRGEIQANTLISIKIGPFLDSTDGNTGETALAIAQADIRLSKNGGNFAQVNHNQGGVDLVHDELGYYLLTLDITDTNTEGRLLVIVHESGGLLVELSYNVLSQAAYESKYGAKDTGYMDINIKAVSEDTVAADNLELACDNYSATRGLTGTALPAAVADAAGGLPISDAGGLDLDTKLANTNEVTAARMGALTDWIDGGRLDLILDIIAADVVNIDGSSIPTAANVVDEWETQSQLDPTGFHVNVKEVNGTAQAANDNSADINAILVDTGELQTDWVDGGRLDLLLDAIKVVTDALPNSGALSDIDTGVNNLETRLTAARGGYLDELAAANLPADVDVLISRVGTPANIDSGGATLADNLKKLADDNGGADFNATTDSAQAIRDRGDAAWTTGAGTGLTALATGTAQAGAGDTITLTAGASATNDLHNGCRILLTGGTGAGQSRVITDYDGGTKVATVAPNWVTNPANDTAYEIQGADSNLGAILNDNQSVDDLKDFADAGYDPATKKVQGVVLVDTTTTNTDMVAAAPTAIQNRQEMDSNSTQLSSIVDDTNELQTDWTNDGRLDLILDIIAGDVANIDGAAMRGTDNAALASVLGALADVAAAGDPTNADTLMQYLKQVVNILAGTAGIGTFPAEAAPGNAVSLAEVIRAIHVDVTGLNGDAMRGTDSGALAAVCTETRLAELDAVNLPTDIAAIPTTAMRGTDNAALASVATESRLAELDDANLPADIAAIPTTAMRGTDNAATAVSLSTHDGKLDTAQLDLDTLTGADGVTLATSQPNYAPNVVIPDVAGTAATPAEVATELTNYDAPTKAEMDSAHALLATVAKQDIIDGIVDAILVDTGTTIPALIAALQDLSAADVAAELATYDAPTKAEMDAAHALLATPVQVNAQVLDVLNVDTYTEPGQGAPPASPTIRQMVHYNYKQFRNKEEQTSTQYSLYNDAGDTIDHKATVSDDNTTAVKGEIVSGA